MAQCEFLATYYTDIFNKIRKDNIDLAILEQVFAALEDIETGRCDQHEASFKVGTLLKKVYVDSALRAADKLQSNVDEAAAAAAAATDGGAAAAPAAAAAAVVDVVVGSVEARAGAGVVGRAKKYSLSKVSYAAPVHEF